MTQSASEQTKEPDIVERLKAKWRYCKGNARMDTWCVYRDAIAEITRLRAERPGWREALEKIVDHTGMVGSERIDVLQIALTEINVCARAALSHPIPGDALEKATLAVRDEVGSQLCRWTSIGKRVCEAVPEGSCLCRDAARAALHPSVAEGGATPKDEGAGK